MVKNYRKFVQDIGLIGLANILNNFKSIAVIPILTKMIGSIAYGIWVQFKITALLVTPLVAMGIQNSIVKYLSGEKNKRKINEDFYSAVAISLLGGSIICLLFNIFQDTLSLWIFGSTKYRFIVKILSIIVPLESLNFLFLEYLKAFRRINIYSATLIFETISELGLIVYIALGGCGIMGVIASLLFIRIIFATIRYRYIFRDLGFSLPKLKNFNRNIAFGLPLLFSAVFFFIADSGDRYVINYFLGLKYVSLYSLAYSLAYIIVLATAPIGYILYPALGASFNNKNYEDALIYIKYSIKYLLIIDIAVTFAIWILSKSFITILSTNDFYGVVTFMPLLLIGLLIFQVGVISEYIIMLFNRTKLVMVLHLVLAIINIILNIILIPYFGIFGAAFATALTCLIFTIFNVIYSQRFIKYKIDFNLIWKCIISAVIMVTVMSLLNPQSLFKISFSVILGAIIYFLVLYFLNIFERNEIAFFKSFLQTAKRQKKLSY